MSPNRSGRAPLRGFTLLELLLVVGLIAGLAAFAIRGFSSTASIELRQAESAIAGQLALARASAIQRGNVARLLVNLDSTDIDVRFAVIAVIAKNHAGSWELVQQPLQLSPKVRVVPDSNVPVPPDVIWPTKLISRWIGRMTWSAEGLPAGSYGYLEFSRTGGIANGYKMSLSTVRMGASGAVFDSPTVARCFLLRRTGVASVLKEVSSIP